VRHGFQVVEDVSFGAQGWVMIRFPDDEVAYALPCQRLAQALAGRRA